MKKMRRYNLIIHHLRGISKTSKFTDEAMWPEFRDGLWCVHKTQEWYIWPLELGKKVENPWEKMGQCLSPDALAVKSLTSQFVVQWLSGLNLSLTLQYSVVDLQIEINFDHIYKQHSVI